MHSYALHCVEQLMPEVSFTYSLLCEALSLHLSIWVGHDGKILRQSGLGYKLALRSANARLYKLSLTSDHSRISSILATVSVHHLAIISCVTDCFGQSSLAEVTATDCSEAGVGDQ